MPRLILASQSPQRRTLLSNLGVEFEVIPSSFDEEAYKQDDPLSRAIELAAEKTRSVFAEHPDAYVLGGDTLVVSAEGEILEKPVDEDDARRMMALHSGSASLVHSSVHLCAPDGTELSDCSTSTLHFQELTSEMIDAWVALKLWKDRSGAFQIEGEGEKLLKSFEGDREGIIGLPVGLVKGMLEQYGLV